MSKSRYRELVCHRCDGLFTAFTARRRKCCDVCLPIVKQEIRVVAAASPQHREAARQIGLANKGKRCGVSGEKHHAWKGSNVGKDALHFWVIRHKSDPNYCEHCGSTTDKLEWSNISQEYKRDLDDWQRLCRSCHLKYDNRAGVRNGSQKAVHSGLL